ERTIRVTIRYLEASSQLAVRHKPGRPSEYRVRLTPAVVAGVSGAETPAPATGTLGASCRTPLTRTAPYPGNEPGIEPDPSAARSAQGGAAVKRDPKTARRPKAPPDHRILPLLTDFAEAHERALGTRYLIRAARDSAHLKAALDTYEEATI